MFDLGSRRELSSFSSVRVALRLIVFVVSKSFLARLVLWSHHHGSGFVGFVPLSASHPKNELSPVSCCRKRAKLNTTQAAFLCKTS